MKQATVRRVRFVIRGLVQGVNFRAATVREASSRRLTGRVWNRDDGAVEVVAEGDVAAIDEFARWLRDGPRLAEVQSVDREELGGDRHYRDFSLSYGAVS